jgi:hypothetical protein
MNLARHASVLWRFRLVAVAGLTIGIVLAILASYKVGFDGGPSLTPRGSETWTATSSILVTQPGFPEGRVTLPEEQTEAAVTAGGEPIEEDEPKDQVTFADPARLSGLADLYAKFLTSDDVLQHVPGRPKAAQVTASPFLASSGGVVLPVIQLATDAPSSPGAKQLNQQVFKSLSSLIEDQQVANGIGKGQRVEVKLIDAPESVLTSPRKKTAAILALFLCLLGTVAVAHLLEGLRPRPTDPIDGIVDWDLPLAGEPDPDDEVEPQPRTQAFEFTGRRRR